MESLLNHAKRVARGMSKDWNEMDSIAGSALFRAMQSYNQSVGLLPKQWVTVCVKRAVWDFWRRQSRTEFRSESYWLKQSFSYTENPLPVSVEDWQLLYEKFIERWPFDVVAREHSMTVPEARRAVAAAKSRFIRAMEEQDA